MSISCLLHNLSASQPASANIDNERSALRGQAALCNVTTISFTFLDILRSLSERRAELVTTWFMALLRVDERKQRCIYANGSGELKNRWLFARNEIRAVVLENARAMIVSVCLIR